MLKWGIIGLGHIANSFANDLALLDNHELYAVASRSKDKSISFSKTHNASHCYGSYEDLLADNTVEVIYVATPHNSHHEWTIKALQAGKHVLCEKPLAVNTSQVQEMISAATENKRFLMEALWSRFNPSIKKVITRCEQGEIGTLTSVQAQFSLYRKANPDSRLFNLDLAGGSLLDVGIYPVFLAYVLMGIPDKIQATSKFYATGADLQTSLIFEYPDGLATLHSGFNSDGENIAVVSGTAGRFVLTSRWLEAQSYYENINNISKSHQHPTVGRGYSYEIQEVKKCLEAGKLESELWSHQHSLDLIQILDQIRNQIGLQYPFE